MAYSTPVTFVALQTLTAAQLNAMQTNISALWPYAAAGDIPYATAANTLSKLTIGATGSMIRSTGSAPTWFAKGGTGAIMRATASTVGWLELGAAGTSLRSDGTNPVWSDATSAVDLALLADLSVVNATYTTVDWTSEAYDTNGMHSLVSNPSRVTIVETGYYFVCLQAIWEVYNAGYREALILKNGTTTLRKDSTLSQSGLKICQTLPGLEYLTAGDYLTCQAWQNSGVNQSLLYSADGLPEKYAYTRFSVIKL